MTLVLGPALRAAIMGEATIADPLQKWKGHPAVFTRRPLPDDAPDHVIIINPAASVTDEDGLNSDRPIVLCDIAVYGKKGPAGDASDQTRLVEAQADRLRTLFHRQKFSVRPEGFSITGIVVAGPIPAPVDDDETVGRLVSLTIRLRRNP